MSASFVVPVGPDFQDVIQVLLVDGAKAVQHLVLEGLNDTFDERLKVRRFDRRFLDCAAIACEHVVERLNVFGVLVTLQYSAGQVLVLKEHVEVASLLRRPIARRIGSAGRNPDAAST